VVAPGLGLVAGAAVGGDEVAEASVPAPERAVLGLFGGQGLSGVGRCHTQGNVSERLRFQLHGRRAGWACNVGPRVETWEGDRPRQRAREERGDDAALLAALRAGDERAFERLVARHHAALVRVARQYVPTQEIAEDVAQEAWLGLLRGLDSFEGRSSLRTYLFRIVMNLARTRGVREARSAPFSSLVRDDEDGPSVAPERFIQSPARGAGHWASPIRPWSGSAEQIALTAEAVQKVYEAIARLPEAQRRVVTLRDVEGFSADEVCDLLELSEGNQRVLLHRARTKLRQALAEYYA
jgi:RNA polymerase sigma-70 factor (ECF subfamily)